MSIQPDLSPQPEKPLHKNEQLKAESRWLRGNILRDLADQTTGSVTEDSTQLMKFHGVYQQDDRDLRNQRRKEGKEKAFIFMARVRTPGGVVEPAQWLEIDKLADTHGNGTLKLTTRQSFQFHGVVKHDLRPLIREINVAAGLNTKGACGDINRGVMCNPNPEQSALHRQVWPIMKAVSDHLLPRTRAYHELWVDDQLVDGGEPEDDPIYGRSYLPRKFKIAFAIPPSNDVDVYGNDLGFVAIAEGDKLIGFNVLVGGGMGMSHNQLETFPRVADVMAYCTPEQVVDVAEKVVLVQRDFGDRVDRKHARFKYTVEDRGLGWIREEVEKRLGYRLQSPRHFEFTHSGDRYGWVESENGHAHFTLFIQSGRVKDTADYPLKTGLREIAKVHQGDFRLSANQNLVIGNVRPAERPRIEALLRQYKLDTANRASGLKLNAMSCVALPTCGLALAESERALPDLVAKFEQALETVGLRDDEITLRITGCPNGCGRPFLGEIGLIGKAPGKYNVYLGAAFNGSRMNVLYKASVPIAEVLPLLEPIFRDYASTRTPGERFGDFTIRKGFVAPTNTPHDFHEQRNVAVADQI
ncbi:MAG TPA: NADPH-dependent assimilatory sulfite reductase hemoprotein subunit [Opitutaceae bacterium]|nr:NADPH-dependent assimilatory sulfite reductase hemoprotein subunit [Opitutaceae bacterium]